MSKAIHPNLKWKTILSRLNEHFGYYKYCIDAYGAIYEFIDDAWHFVQQSFINTTLEKEQKNRFLFELCFV